MKYRRIVLCSLLILSLAACRFHEDYSQYAPKDIYSFDSVVSKKMVPNDPGPAPAYNAADYSPYFQTGKNVISGSPVVVTSDGQTHTCGQGDYVWLYPSTPYTLWMLSKAMYVGYTKNQFNDPAVTALAPDFLHFNSKNTIVREGDCQNGSFMIANLPSGKYAMFASIRAQGYEANIVTNTYNGMGPGGPATVFENRVVGGTVPEDGWILGTAPFELNEHQSAWSFPASAWAVLVHASVGQ